MDKSPERVVLELAAAGSSQARDVVTGIIAEEHRTLRIVMQVLRHMLHEVADYGMPADFTLFSSILYYVDEFPERVHHPKEDRYLFPMLRRRTSRFDSILEHLQTEHVHSAQMLTRIQRDLVHFQAGAPRGLERFAAGVDTYARLLEAHMQAEEQLLLDAREELTEDDWRHLAQGLGAQRDPLAADPSRNEFRVLRARILNALPSKMRLDPDSARTMRDPGLE